MFLFVFESSILCCVVLFCRCIDVLYAVLLALAGRICGNIFFSVLAGGVNCRSWRPLLILDRIFFLLRGRYTLDV